MKTPRSVLVGLLCAFGLLSGDALGQSAEEASAEAGDPGLVEAVPGEVGAGEPSLTKALLEEYLASLGPEQEAEAAVYREAIAAIEVASANRAQAEAWQRQAADASELLTTIRAELALPAATPEAVEVAGESLEALERRAEDATAALNAARAQLAELTAEATRRQTRRAEIPGLISRALQRAEDASEARLTAAASEQSDALTLAQRRLLEAREAAALAEVASLQAELANYDARLDLLPARQDRAARRVSLASARSAALLSAVRQKRQVEADRAAQEAAAAQRQAARQHPALSAFATETQRLAELRTGEDSGPKRIGRYTRSLATARQGLAELRAGYASAKRRIETAGLNRSTGLLLRRQYETLPDVRALRSELQTVRAALEEAQYTLIEIQEDRLGTGDIERVTGEVLEEIDEPTEEMRAVARELAVARRDLLGQLAGDASRELDVLLEHESVSSELLEAVEAYESFVLSRILWVRSIGVSDLPTGDQIGSTVAWLGDGEAWRSGLGKMWDQVERRSAVALLGGILVVFLLAWRVRSGLVLSRLAQLVGRYKTDRMRYTLAAVGVSVVSAMALPAVLWWVGSWLASPLNQEGVVGAVGLSLRANAVLLFPLMLLVDVIRADGLAAAHFRWSTVVVRRLRWSMRWFVPTVLASSLVVMTTEYANDEAAAASVGRIAFTVGMVALIALFVRLGRPGGAMMSELLRGKEASWAYRLRYVWFGVLVLTPTALLVITWLGYYFTAVQLEVRLESTIALFLVLLLIQGVMMRWLFVARRRVAVEDARRSREQAAQRAAASAAAGADGSEGNTPTDVPVAAVDEETLNLPAISERTRQLFRTLTFVSAVAGLYLIWSGVLPALQALDRVQLYPSVMLIESGEADTIPILEGEGAAVDAAAGGDAASGASGASGGASGGGSGGVSGGGMGVPMMPSGESASGSASGSAPALRITLANVGAAILALAATLLVFRNLPGLAEMIILQRLPLDAGSRYALTTVLRYLIAIIGIAIAFNAINVAWSNVQWLAAALTFGLAFGLQEIFANFVSGLIILAERPVRIGDTVTVGNVSGTVSRIRMRATTITDWDRKELVIPNKNFITGEVINWSLSDPMLRLSIPVGVGYGEDIRLAEQVLLRVARAHPNVLKEPKPFVVFMQFGDSTLNFELRVFIPSVEYLVAMRHDLHMLVMEAFREEGIEIAFPQRDLHVRSIGDLDKLVARASDVRDDGPADGGSASGSGGGGGSGEGAGPPRGAKPGTPPDGLTG